MDTQETAFYHPEKIIARNYVNKNHSMLRKINFYRQTVIGQEMKKEKCIYIDLYIDLVMV